MWISKKKYEALERRIYDLEEKVKDNNVYSYYTPALESNAIWSPSYGYRSEIKIQRLLDLILEYLKLEVSPGHKTKERLIQKV